MRQLVLTGENLINAREVGISRYMYEVSKIPMMSPEEELEVAKLAEQGDEEAIQKLVTANLRFVISVAKTYNKGNLYISDLINEGNIGLVEAANLFKTDLGFKFISFAVWHVRKNILKFIADKSKQIRIPNNKYKMLRDFDKIESRLSHSLQRKPTREEVIEEYINDDTILNKEKVNDLDIDSINETRTSPLSLFSDDSDKNSLIDILSNGESSPDDALLKESSSKLIMSLVNTLTAKERDIIILRFGLEGERPKTFAEIAMKYGKTSESIRTWYKKAIRRLKYKAFKEYPEIKELNI